MPYDFLDWEKIWSDIWNYRCTAALVLIGHRGCNSALTLRVFTRTPSLTEVKLKMHDIFIACTKYLNFRTLFFVKSYFFYGKLETWRLILPLKLCTLIWATIDIFILKLGRWWKKPLELCTLHWATIDIFELFLNYCCRIDCENSRRNWRFGAYGVWGYTETKPWLIMTMVMKKVNCS